MTDQIKDPLIPNSTVFVSMQQQPTQIEGAKKKSGALDIDDSKPSLNLSGEFENEDMGFWKMTWLLIWKNYMMQCRRMFRWWLCKILCPAVFFLVLALLRTIVTVTNEDVNYATRTPYYNPYFISNATQTTQFVGNLLCDPSYNNQPPGFIGIVPNPNSNPHIQGVLDIMQEHWYSYDVNNLDTLQSCYNQSAYLPWKEGILFKYFDSNDDLENYCTEDDYATTWNATSDNGKRPISIAIVFYDPTENGTQWSYEIRANDSKVPGTLSQYYVDQFVHDISTLWATYAGEYLSSGFVQLQVFVDNAITEYISKYQNMSTSNTSKYTYNMVKGYQAFPTPSYESDNYWNYVGFAFVYFIVFGFVYPFNQVAAQLVHEKSYKTKEGMKMMGATVTTYWTAWYAWLWFEFTLIVVLCWAVGTIGNVFKYSAPGVIFLWLYTFGMAVMTFGTLVSTIFDNPRTAATVCNVMLTFGMLGGFSGQAMTSESQKNALCLLAPACLTVSVTSVMQYETGLIGLQWSNINQEYQYFRFKNALLIMALDAIIYFVLTLYLDRVWPSRYGQRESWYFLCKPSYWITSKKENKSLDESSQSELLLRRRMSSLMSSEVYEPVGDEYTNKRPAISMRDLKKVFGDDFGQNQVKAVNGVSLDIYEGEVFCLLGHNGAGKTTTIGMLTGLLEITTGDAHISGLDVKTQMRQIRRNLGVCPQHDILWPRLTSREHLELFGLLKGIPKDKVKNEVDKTLTLVGLKEKEHEFPPNMSGGQKRKLSLGIALIGGSKVLFLDEPTSGMDPQSRRTTWDLIEREKKTRAIVLTTHFMDEADILADRIAIMSSGEVRCCGSSLFLKQKFGVGYTFVVSLEVGVKPTMVRNKIDAVVLGAVDGASVISMAGGEIAYRLPFSETGSFPNMFEELDEKKAELKITGYGVSVTTLEEVFMKIGEDFGAVDKETGNFVSNRLSMLKEKLSSKKRPTAISTTVQENETTALVVETNEVKEEKVPETDKSKDETMPKGEDEPDLSQVFAQPSCRLQEEREFDVLLSHCWAIMYKRFWWAMRDGRAMFFVVFLPCLITALFFGIQNLQLAIDYPNLVLNVDQWYAPNVYEVPFANFTGVPSVNELYNGNWEKKYEGTMASSWGSFVHYVVEVTSNPYTSNTTLDWQEQLLNHRGDSSNMHYTSVYFNPYMPVQVTSGFNLSAVHSFPTSFSMFDNWVLQILFPNHNAKIVASTHPLPATASQKVFAGSIAGLTASIALTIALVFVPVGIVFPVVQERKQQMKHQQLVSGVSFASYWFGQFAADFLVALPTCALIVIMVHAFDISSFLGAAEGPFIVTIILYLLSVLPLTYLLSLLFESPDKAQASLTLLYVLLGFVLSIVTFVLMIINAETKKVGDTLRYFFRASPIYCMAFSLIMISFQPFIQSESFWDYDLTGKNFCAMGVETVLYFALLLLVEYVSGYPSLMKKLGFSVDVPRTNTGIELDTDVLEEQKRIREELTDENTLRPGATTRDTVHICGLRKVYKMSDSATPFKVAVEDLWFGIPQGQVFGFLGVNGAGKTTTLKMLTGDTHPSDGHAFIYGVPIENQIEARRLIGYCPQFDAIFDLLTPYEHLKFYGIVKGLKGAELEKQVRVLLNALSLTKYKNRKAGALSGGNKRKLSTAIAMIGNPPVVFLDEPSTGMDPVSRRHMWSFINTTMEGRCVILTTHSMEECEALCHRLGIMVHGQLRCLGTPQHLKSRFGKGYQLDITFKNQDSPEERKMLRKRVEEELKEKRFLVKLIESNQNKATFELGFEYQKEGAITLAQMFRLLEEVKEKLSIVSYALNQTTLEQIFVNMANEYGAVSEY